MEAKDWGKIGNQWVFNSNVHSREDALKRGYSDYSDGKTNNTYSSKNGDVTLNSNGSWTQNGNTYLTADRGIYEDNSVTGISTLNPKDNTLYSGSVRGALENRDVNGQNLIETGQTMQTVEDVVTVTCLGVSVTGVGAIPGGVMVLTGGLISKVGLGTEMTGDFIKNGFNKKTIFNNSSKIGLSLFFGALGDKGVSATRVVAGKGAVKAGENRISEAVIQGTVMGAEKTTDQFLNYKK